MRAFVTYTFGINFHPVERFDHTVHSMRVGSGNYTPVVAGTARAGDGGSYEVSFPILSLDLQNEESIDAFKVSLAERINKMVGDFKAKWHEINSLPSEMAGDQEKPASSDKGKKTAKKPAKKAK